MFSNPLLINFIGTTVQPEANVVTVYPWNLEPNAKLQHCASSQKMFHNCNI